jgi:hypothetical protein
LFDGLNFHGQGIHQRETFRPRRLLGTGAKKPRRIPKPAGESRIHRAVRLSAALTIKPVIIPIAPVFGCI